MCGYEYYGKKVLNDRQNKILRMIVRDYVASARPVGSTKLVKRHKMTCSSATVRNDMSLMEEMGLLMQSHISSGRIPTESGFRYYIDYLMIHRDIPTRFRRRIVQNFKAIDCKKYSLAVRLLANELSALTNNLTVVTIPPDRMEISGMRYVFKHPEFCDFEVVRNFGFVIDNLEEIIFDIRNRMRENNFQVFVAKELGYEYTHQVAIAVRKFRDPFGEEHVIGSVGPIRMDYNILPNLMNFASEILEDF